jgi:NADH:ubiquinone oxidoreductase subunit E
VDGALLPILHAVQEEYGYVPPAAVTPIAKFLRATPPQIYAIITFYSEFRTKRRSGTVVGICRGPACRLAGGLSLQADIERRLGIRAGETTPDGRFSLETVSCLGICGLAPAVEVGHETLGRVDDQRVEAIVEEAQTE